MKKLLFILLFCWPIIGFTQQNWYKSSPSEYMWKYVGDTNFSAHEMSYVSLAFNPSDNMPYVAYTDYGFSNKLTVMKFDGTRWSIVGTAGFSADEANFISLVFNQSGEPFVAFSDGHNSGRTTVMKFNGTTWEYVGDPRFSPDVAYSTHLAISQSGQPFVAFSDFACPPHKASVMKFDGINWVYVGNAGFSLGKANFTSLAFSQSGQPYVAYSDFANYERATVMKFNGTDWVNVGNAGCSASKVLYINLEFSPSDTLPYIAFTDFSNSNPFKTTAMKFDGTNWVIVGNAGFSPNGGYPTLAFSPTGQPYVAFGDDTINHKATVMKFDGINWFFVGNAGFSGQGEVWQNSIAINALGEPYIAFVECDDNCVVSIMKYDSVSVGINELIQNRLKVYPTPSSGKITVESSELQSQGQLTILNLGGQQLMQQEITEPKTTIDVSHLTPGIYMVKMVGDKKVMMGKFVKH